MPSTGEVKSSPTISTISELPSVSSHREKPAAPELEPTVPPSGTFAKESLVLDEMLDRYEQAYDRLDARAAAQIWNSVDSRALARAFSLLRHQDLHFDVCSFVITESHATAHCPGELRYARRIGDTTPKHERHVWTIEFARSGETWQIVRVSAR
jgi:hypothetical protein